MFKSQVKHIIASRKKNLDANDFFIQIKRANRKQEAVEATKQILDFDPTWTTAQYQYGMALIRLGKHKEALQHFADCTKIHTEWMSALYHLGICHLKVGNEKEAIETFKNILKLDHRSDIDEYCKTFETLGDLYFTIARRSQDKEFRDRTIEDLKKICDLDIEKHGLQPWSMLYIGATQFYQNKITDALKSFEKASELADPMNTSKPFIFKSAYGCYSTKSFITLNSMLSKPSSISEPEITMSNPNDSDLVILISCDESYFNRFSSSFLATLQETNKGLTVHFHIIGSKSVISGQIQQNTKDMKNNRKITIQYSFEEKPAHENNTYYALSRFIIAHKVLEHYDCPIIICDIDAAVTGDLRLVKSYVGDNDVGVDANYNTDAFKKFPWNSISGGFLYINNTKLGLNYAKTLSHLMLENFNPQSPKTWWLDQSILYSTTFYMKNHTFNFKVTSLLGESAPRPFIFSIPGKNKDEFSATIKTMIASGEYSKMYA